MVRRCGLAIALALIAVWQLRGGDEATPPVASRGAVAPPVVERVAPALAVPAPAVVADERIARALETLPAGDARWVLDEVERTLSIRALDGEQQRRLVEQLVSVRTHEVLARTESYAGEVQP